MKILDQKTPPLILIILFSLLFNFSALAEQEPLPKSLPLECSDIPTRQDKICFIETESPYGPYDDVVFYHMNKNGSVFLLGSQSGDVATFGGFDFSPSGIYMWLEWAEEGHPHFEFFKTSTFINNGTSAESLQILGDYYFTGFEKFSDTGEVIYSLDDGAFEDCDKAGKDVSYKINPETSEKYCIKRFNINHPN